MFSFHRWLLKKPIGRRDPEHRESHLRARRHFILICVAAVISGNGRSSRVIINLISSGGRRVFIWINFPVILKGGINLLKRRATKSDSHFGVNFSRACAWFEKGSPFKQSRRCPPSLQEKELLSRRPQNLASPLWPAATTPVNPSVHPSVYPAADQFLCQSISPWPHLSKQNSLVGFLEGLKFVCLSS